jgi:hypothetical protein
MAMLFTCTPPGSRIPGRFPGPPPHARGKWFTIDIHCHVRSDKAAALVEGREEVSRWFLETAASPESQAQNRANGVRTRAQGNSPEQRIADMGLLELEPDPNCPDIFRLQRTLLSGQAALVPGNILHCRLHRAGRALPSPRRSAGEAI